MPTVSHQTTNVLSPVLYSEVLSCAEAVPETNHFLLNPEEIVQQITTFSGRPEGHRHAAFGDNTELQGGQQQWFQWVGSAEQEEPGEGGIVITICKEPVESLSLVGLQPHLVSSLQLEDGGS